MMIAVVHDHDFDMMFFESVGSTSPRGVPLPDVKEPEKRVKEPIVLMPSEVAKKEEKKKRAAVILCSGGGGDSENVLQFLRSQGVEEDETICLLQEGGESEQPTREEVIKAFATLVEGAEEGKPLFLYLQGSCGTQGGEGKERGVATRNGLALTCRDIMQHLLVPLPPHAQLTALLDCCDLGFKLQYSWEDGGWQEGASEEEKEEVKADVCVLSVQSDEDVKLIGDYPCSSGSSWMVESCREAKSVEDLAKRMIASSALHVTQTVKVSSSSSSSPHSQHLNDFSSASFSIARRLVVMLDVEAIKSMKTKVDMRQLLALLTPNASRHNQTDGSTCPAKGSQQKKADANALFLSLNSSRFHSDFLLRLDRMQHKDRIISPAMQDHLLRASLPSDSSLAMEDVKDLIVFSQTLVRPLWEKEKKKNSTKSTILTALEQELVLYQNDSFLLHVSNESNVGEALGRLTMMNNFRR
ncbi:hypothetical protein GUITHDRAFT_112120 [Guillardia theta CCMP2712]|uniref:Uncharacterized protein n=1 Tax=Guillardia theta (strain CCMP2712) TaxID=905079 RepID=L1IZN4_GUITC|nr:hypothetical protein GUITHDRAFT_112120 [Guillardia theta CCMP2712]EKX41706.1 hypothetical protein GUITHDRAFT_112120 [Guillardia theta CCMP2712]|eukprot:XP_005828686.1 hypothetical protein GUITHDRAFT_112120 [Guillardia theta CCMP2712]